MDFSDPHFAEPGWLWLAVLGPLVLAGLEVYASRARLRQARQLASQRFLATLLQSVSPARRRVKRCLLLLAVVGIGIVMARPQWGHQREAITTASASLAVRVCPLISKNTADAVSATRLLPSTKGRVLPMPKA